MDACILPAPSSLNCYYGTTTSDAPVSFPPFWCSTIQNNHWFAFTADATTASFDISVFGCASGNGLQAAILSTSDCVNFNFVSPCLGDIPTQTTQTLTATSLTPGQNYYLCIDGSGGALCDYAINGSVPTVNGPADGLCIPSSPSGIYTTAAPSAWSISPSSAGNIIGSSSGTSITVQWVQPGSAQVCAQSLQCSNAPENCLDVIVGEDVNTDEDVYMCQGYSANCAGQTFSQPGTFIVNLPTYLNCDSLVHCVVHLIPTVYTTEIVPICQGGTAICAGEEFTIPGNYPIKLTNYQGCDSIINCKITLIPTYVSPYALINLCGPTTFEVCNNTLTESGLYTELCTGYQGCDSIVNINLAILEPHAIIAPPGILNCEVSPTLTLDGSGSSPNNAVGGTSFFTWSGPGIVGFNNLPTVQVNQPGTYCLISRHGRGGVFCSDTTCVNVTALSTVPQLPQVTGNLSPCGDSTYIYTATAQGLPAPTSFTWILPGNVPFTTLSPFSIQVTWDTVIAAPLCVTANNLCGSSLPSCLPIIVQAPIEQPNMTGPASVCASGGDYKFVINNYQFGTTYNWTIPPGAVLFDVYDTVFINFQNASSGQVCVTAENYCGAGTPVCLGVQVNGIPTADLSSDAEICAGDSVNLNFALSGGGPFDVTWTINGDTLTLDDITNGHTIRVSPSQTTTYSILDIRDNSNPACAATVIDSVVVTVREHYSTTDTIQICGGASLFVGGALQTTSGVYTDSLQTVHGCDSVLVTNLQVLAVDTLVLNSVSCNPMLVGTTTQILTQTNGCDSVIIRVVALQPSDTTRIFDTNCDLSNVGITTHVLSNVFGCDSTVITTVTFALSDTSMVSSSTCNPAATGVFYQNLLTTDGCDSLIITTVTLLEPDTLLLSGTTCNAGQAGVFPEVFTNQLGCDSTVITTILFVPLTTTFVSKLSCNPAEIGVFNNTFLTSEGCDSVVVTAITLLPSSTTLLSGSSCNPLAVGVFTQVLTNQFGCDSTVTTTIGYVPLAKTFLTATTCDPASTGVFTNTITTAEGCDSIVVTTVSLLPSSSTMLSGNSCNPAAVGVFTQVLSNQFGCDSTVTTTIGFTPLATTFRTAKTCDPAATGVFSNTITTAQGCDSTVVTTVSLLPSSTTLLSGSSCNPSDVGVFTQTLTNQYGCDSTVVTTISLLPSNQTSLQTTTCDPTLAGIFTYPLTNQFGCDSIVTETKTLLPSSMTTINLNTCDPTQVGSTTSVVSNQWGCDSTIVTLTSLLPPNSCAVAGTLVGSNIPCNASTATLTLTVNVGAAPFTYTVLLGGNTVATGTVNTLGVPKIISGLSTGNYTVNISSVNGFSTTTQASIVPLQTPGLTATPNTNYSGFGVRCNGANDGSVVATANGGVAPYSFSWSNGSNTAQVNNLGAGVFTVTVVDANGCTNVASVSLTTPAPLAIQFTVNNLDCFSQNDGAIQVETSGGAPPYQFSLNNGPVQDSNIFTGLASGSYTLTAADANDCQQTEAIVVNAATPVNVDLGDNINIGLGDNATLQAIVNVPFDSILSVVWTPPFDTSECPGCLTQVVTPFVSTVYSVQVEALNGCSGADKVTVIVDRRRQIYVPNVFSPNDDGANDLFSIFAKPGTVRKILSLQIFDRWGNAIFLQEDFLPNSAISGWDGRYKGEAMNPAVFVWVAEIEFADGEREIFKGDITIVR